MLEAETAPEKVEVAITTREDQWAIRALNLHVGLTQLRETGMTRELPLFGWVLSDYGGGGGGSGDDGGGGRVGLSPNPLFLH